MKKSLLAIAMLAVAASAFAEVTIEKPWVRGTVAHQQATGAFMQLRADADTRLVGAHSPVAAEAQIHEMATVDNVMKMRQIDGLALKKGEQVELKPGGYHVMLLGLKQTLSVGQTVPLTLVFQGKDGKQFKREVKAPVQGLGAAAMPAMGASGHGMPQH